MGEAVQTVHLVLHLVQNAKLGNRNTLMTFVTAVTVTTEAGCVELMPVKTALDGVETKEMKSVTTTAAEDVQFAKVVVKKEQLKLLKIFATPVPVQEEKWSVLLTLATNANHGAETRETKSATSLVVQIVQLVGTNFN